MKKWAPIFCILGMRLSAAVHTSMVSHILVICVMWLSYIPSVQMGCWQVSPDPFLRPVRIKREGRRTACQASYDSLCIVSMMNLIMIAPPSSLLDIQVPLLWYCYGHYTFTFLWWGRTKLLASGYNIHTCVHVHILLHVWHIRPTLSVYMYTYTLSASAIILCKCNHFEVAGYTYTLSHVNIRNTCGVCQTMQGNVNLNTVTEIMVTQESNISGYESSCSYIYLSLPSPNSCLSHVLFHASSCVCVVRGEWRGCWAVTGECDGGWPQEPCH